VTSQHSDPERLARAALTYLAEPADRLLTAMVAAAGTARTVEAIKAGRVATCIKHASWGSQRAAWERAERRWQVRLPEIPAPEDLRRFARQGIRLVCPGDPEWPSQLDDLREDVPYALWLRGTGDLRFSCLRSVAVVGSRAATAYGSYMATEISASLAARGWTVVSGAAYGIDAAAHRGALGEHGTTIAVLACGVDKPYPAGHASLITAIADGGVVMSEWPPGRNVTRLRFLTRNRVLAALTRGTLVVEAAARSGALNTSRHATSLHRPLMAVPGPVTSGMSTGCHTLIRDHAATLTTSADDVITLLAALGEDNATTAPQPVLPWDELAPDLRTVLDSLPTRSGISTSEVAIRAGLDVDTVMSSLGALTAGGFAERCAGGWRVRRAARATSAS
jgi:DNA processing protein